MGAAALIPLAAAVAGPLMQKWLGGGQAKGQYKQLSTQNPQQQQYMQQLFSGLQGGQSNIPGMEYLQGLFSEDPSAFQKYEAPMMRQFNEQVIPGIAERFTNMGAGGTGSGFNNAAAMAGARLSENLGAQRANLRGSALNQFQNYGQQFMQPSFDNIYERGQGGIMSGPGGAGIIQLLMSLLQGGMGGMGGGGNALAGASGRVA